MTPIDERDAKKPGGHGESWWTLRFSKTRQRLSLYERRVKLARAQDEAIAGAIGSDGSGRSPEKLVEKIRAFYQDEQDRLSNDAGRHGVPRGWRR